MPAVFFRESCCFAVSAGCVVTVVVVPATAVVPGTVVVVVLPLGSAFSFTLILYDAGFMFQSFMHALNRILSFRTVLTFVAFILMLVISGGSISFTLNNF